MLSFQTGQQLEYKVFWGSENTNYHPLPHFSLATPLPSAWWSDRKCRWLLDIQVCLRKKDVCKGLFSRQDSMVWQEVGTLQNEGEGSLSVHFNMNLTACNHVQIKHRFMSIQEQVHRDPRACLQLMQTLPHCRVQRLRARLAGACRESDQHSA